MRGRLENFDLKDKRVLIREDFNVPLDDNGRITSLIRIRAALETIKLALARGAKVSLLSHLGRPKEGQWTPDFSLQPVADALSRELNCPVPLRRLEQPMSQGPIELLENVRFLVGEHRNDPRLAKALVHQMDLVVMDAFAVSHRVQASTVGIIEHSAMACAGPLLQKEVEHLSQVKSQAKSPKVAIIGGAKVSTKLKLLHHLLEEMDTLILGGGIANTFLLAQGYALGQSLVERPLVQEAKAILERAHQWNKKIWLPTDVRVAVTLDGPADVCDLDNVPGNASIFDIGPKSESQLIPIIHHANTLLWNGPLGVFEKPAFAHGTQALALAIAQSQAFSVAGGGDTLSAIEQFNVRDNVSYISTGGGAFLEFFEGHTLPVFAALEQKERSLEIPNIE